MLIIILTHRIGLIICITSAVLLLVLPKILLEETDHDFLVSAQKLLQLSVWLGLVLLTGSGLLRLSFVYPKWLAIKLIIAGLTIIWSFIGNRMTTISKYNNIQLFLILLTTIVGLVI